MLPAYQSAVNQVSASLWSTNPEQAAEEAAVLAERPAQSYYSSQGQGRVDQGWAATQQVLGNPATFTSASGTGGTGGTSGGTNAQLTSILGPFGALFGLIPGVSAISSDFKSIMERVALV